jgi:site-specific DNA recombinase
MDSHWSYRSPAYRCRHGATSANRPATPARNTYIRETVAIAFAASALGVAAEPTEVAGQLVDRGLIIACSMAGLCLIEAPALASLS